MKKHITKAHPTILVNLTIPIINLDPAELAFDPNNGNLYVANFGDGTVSVISGQTNTVIDSVNVSKSPSGIAFDSSTGNLYVTNQVSNNVSVISGQTNTVVGSPIPVGGASFGIALDSTNGYLYVTNSGDGTVSVITVPP